MPLKTALRYSIAPALLAVLLYLPTLKFGTIYDDGQLLPRITNMDVREAFTTDYWRNPATLWAALYYRPLALLAYWSIYQAFDMQVFGIDPVPFHVASVLLHAGATVVFLCLLAALGFEPGVCLAAAFLFAAHPLHVEAVAWISAMIEPLACVLTLLSLLCFVRRERTASLLLGGCAMLVKETALILPALVFMIAWRRERMDHAPRPARAAGIAALPYVPLVGAYLAARWFFLPAAPPDLAWFMFQNLPTTAPATLARYLQLIFFPWPMVMSYRLLGIAWQLAALVALAALITVALRAGEFGRDLLLAVAFMVLTIAAPVLASPLMGEWARVQDRYAYQATAGGCLLIALLVSKGLDRFQHGRFRQRSQFMKDGLLYICLLLTLLGSLAINRQLRYWQNGLTLWVHTLKLVPESEWATNMVAHELHRQRRDADAERVVIVGLRRHHPVSQILLKDLVWLRKLRKQRSAAP